MCLNETNIRVRVDKQMSDMFPFRNGLEQWGCSIANAFQLSFRVRHYEGSGKPEWFEIERYTSTSDYAGDVNMSEEKHGSFGSR